MYTYIERDNITNDNTIKYSTIPRTSYTISHSMSQHTTISYDNLKRRLAPLAPLVVRLEELLIYYSILL